MLQDLVVLHSCYIYLRLKMEAEEVEVQSSRLPYIIPAIDDIFTATLYFVEPFS